MTTVLTAKKQSKYYHMESKNFIHRVGIVQRLLPHYRLPFFQELRNFLALRNVKLDLIYGQGNLNDKAKKDQNHLHWGIKLKNFYLPFNFIYQPCLYRLKKYDIVIIEQANKLLINYYLLLKKNFTRQKVAFWGHGRNYQDNQNSLNNKIKKLYINRVDWWFAYTNKVKDFIVKSGFPKERVTVVQNAIDSGNLIRITESISSQEIESLRSQYSLQNCFVGLFCGGMYKEKRIDFLLDACNQVKKKIPNFCMLFIGGGLDSQLVKNASEKESWIHYLGPQFGKDKVKYFLIADVCLNPGLVGLGILDTFALEAPLITTEYQYHSPEIDYLKTNVNGIISRNSLEDFSSTVVDVLQDKKLLLKLKMGCKESASVYTMKRMVDNFGKGILTCLQV